MSLRLWLFGAGASFGSDKVNVPPIGAALARSLAAHSFEWRSVYDKYETAWRRDFEQQYRRLQGLPVSHTTLHLAMARYFFSFQPSEGNLYRRLAQQLTTSAHRDLLSSLNYDVLLPRSLAAESVQYQIVGLGSEGVEVLLPHGACNIFSLDQHFSGVNIQGAFGRGVVINTPLEVADTIDSFERAMGRNVPPAMSYFIPDKASMVGPAWMRMQRERYAALCDQASTIVIVGVAYREHDDHIWGPIRRSGARVAACCGPETSVQLRSLTATRAVECFDLNWDEAFDSLIGA